MTALTDVELMAWAERTATGWRDLIASAPQLLALLCDVMDTKTVAELLQHIVAVELRYAQRIAGLPETSYDEVGMASGEALYATHDRAMQLLQHSLDDTAIDWERKIDFLTRSAGTWRASRRTLFVHALMHSIRHYAQLATLVRQHGIKPGWPMDYLFMGAERP
jgi:uncharacterized damage-inducible protein DinB